MTNAAPNPDGRVKTAIILTLNRCATTYYENALKEGDAQTKAGVEKAFRTLVPMLVNCLKDEDSDIRAQAAEAVGAFHTEARLAVPALVKVLLDEELWPRHAAASALGEYGAQAKSALPKLKEYAERAGGASERENALAVIKRIESASE